MQDEIEAIEAQASSESPYERADAVVQAVICLERRLKEHGLLDSQATSHRGQSGVAATTLRAAIDVLDPTILCLRGGDRGRLLDAIQVRNRYAHETRRYPDASSARNAVRDLMSLASQLYRLCMGPSCREDWTQVSADSRYRLCDSCAQEHGNYCEIGDACDGDLFLTSTYCSSDVGAVCGATGCGRFACRACLKLPAPASWRVDESGTYCSIKCAEVERERRATLDSWDLELPTLPAGFFNERK